MLRKNNILRFKTIESTNNFLKENYEKVENGTVVVADIQTKGRGRLGRTWVSKKGGLWFSILIKKDIKKPSFYTKLSSISIISILKRLKINAKIKWPNDIYVNSKKLSGILTEAVTVNNNIKCIIIGIGINVNNETPENGVSLSNLLKERLSLDFLLEQFIKEFNKNYYHYRNLPFLLNLKWKKKFNI